VNGRGTKKEHDVSTATARDAGPIWRQDVIPVLYRDTTARQLLFKLPYALDNGWWIRAEKVRSPEWIKQYQCWRIPQSWLNEMVPRAPKLSAVIRKVRRYDLSLPTGGERGTE
jgi:hypothetical protein